MPSPGEKLGLRISTIIRSYVKRRLRSRRYGGVRKFRVLIFRVETAHPIRISQAPTFGIASGGPIGQVLGCNSQQYSYRMGSFPFQASSSKMERFQRRKNKWNLRTISNQIFQLCGGRNGIPYAPNQFNIHEENPSGKYGGKTQEIPLGWALSQYRYAGHFR